MSRRDWNLRNCLFIICAKRNYVIRMNVVIKKSEYWANTQSQPQPQSQPNEYKHRDVWMKIRARTHCVELGTMYTDTAKRIAHTPYTVQCTRDLSFAVFLLLRSIDNDFADLFFFLFIVVIHFWQRTLLILAEKKIFQKFASTDRPLKIQWWSEICLKIANSVYYVNV